MRDYKLHKMGKYAKKVEVRSEHIEIRVPALIICFLMAFFVWLYVVGISRIHEEPVGEDSCPQAEETAAQEPSETAPDGNTPHPSDV